MSRIEEAFHQGDSPLLIACTVAGDPTPELSLEVILSMIESGADMIEVIIPNTNPVADGPVISRAHERAIRGGIGIKGVFSLISAIRRESDIPICLMTYANPVIVRGEAAFLSDAAAAGADGILIVDMPPEEGGVLISQKKIDPIFIIAPNTPPERRAMIGKIGRGFLYLVSAPGVTGTRQHLPDDLGDRVLEVKKSTVLPVAVGFGIGSAETAHEAAAAGADAVIAGSVISGAIERNPDDPAFFVGEAVREIRSGIARHRSSRSAGQ